jgi:hypothetical protein
MASLVDLVFSRMTPEVVQQLAGLAGLSAPDTHRALDAIVPTQVDGLASLGPTEAGARQLLAVLQAHQGPASFAPVLLAGEALEHQAKVGDALQTAVHGSALSSRLGILAVFLDMPQSAVAALMGVVMPVVVGLLGREVRERGLDALGLITWLRGERQPIVRDRPLARVDRLDRQLTRGASRVLAPPRPGPRRPAGGPGCSRCSLLPCLVSGMSIGRRAPRPAWSAHGGPGRTPFSATAARGRQRTPWPPSLASSVTTPWPSRPTVPRARARTRSTVPPSPLDRSPVRSTRVRGRRCRRSSCTNCRAVG